MCETFGMNFISTTELRTKSKDLVNKLNRKEKINLVYRSKVIAEIVPTTINQADKKGTYVQKKSLMEAIKNFNNEYAKNLKSQNPKFNFLEHIQAKYGNLS